MAEKSMDGFSGLVLSGSADAGAPSPEGEDMDLRIRGRGRRILNAEMSLG
jgi:hypothetical protein